MVRRPILTVLLLVGLTVPLIPGSASSAPAPTLGIAEATFCPLQSHCADSGSGAVSTNIYFTGGLALNGGSYLGSFYGSGTGNIAFQNLAVTRYRLQNFSLRAVNVGDPAISGSCSGTVTIIGALYESALDCTIQTADGLSGRRKIFVRAVEDFQRPLDDLLSDGQPCNCNSYTGFYMRGNPKLPL